MKTYLKVMIAAVAVVFLFSPSILSAAGSKQMVATAAPDFELMDIRQDVITLSDYKDKQPVLLFFWATWCPFCTDELRVMNDRYAGMIKDGFEVLSIDVGQDTDTVNNFVSSYHLPYRVLLDRDSSVSRSYGLVGVPTYVLVDKSGDIVFKDNYFPQAEYKKLIPKK